MTETTQPFGIVLRKLLQRQQDVLVLLQAESPAGRQAVCSRGPGAGLGLRSLLGCQVCHRTAGWLQVPLWASVSLCIKGRCFTHCHEILTDLDMVFEQPVLLLRGSSRPSRKSMKPKAMIPGLAGSGVGSCLLCTSQNADAGEEAGAYLWTRAVVVLQEHTPCGEDSCLTTHLPGQQQEAGWLAKASLLEYLLVLEST